MRDSNSVYVRDYEKPTTYSFRMTRPDGSALTYECELHHTTWPELVEEFTYFLRGCGFHVDGELEFISYDEQNEAAEQRRKEKWGPWDEETGDESITELGEERHETSESMGLENTTGSGKEL